MVELAENRYGKSRVRLMKVIRKKHEHELREWTVDVTLRGDFRDAHLLGDNSNILPTDTIKNTIYSLARSSTATSMEDFAKELVNFLIDRNPQVTTVSLHIESTLWKRLTVDGRPHPSAFMRGSGELQTATVERSQHEEFRIISGLQNLVLLKTDKSAFEGFIKDSLTTLPETRDRLFGTAVSAHWCCSSPTLDFDTTRSRLREAMLRTFADHDSKSVQQTLYAMAESALEEVSAVEEITLAMPNKHCLLVDLSRFGQDNPNEIFVPTDEPHGYIEARVRRNRNSSNIESGVVL